MGNAGVILLPEALTQRSMPPESTRVWEKTEKMEKKRESEQGL